MQHGFLITAYRDIEGLLTLIDGLGPEAHVFVHLDGKARVPQEDLDRLTALPTLRLLSRRYAVNWGSSHHLLSIIELAKAATGDARIDHLHLISGSDRLVVPWPEFTAFFNHHRGSEFIEHFPLPTSHWKGGGVDRITLFHPLDLLNYHSPRQRRIHDLLLSTQRKLGIRRSLRGLPALYGGSTWWSLSRACVSHLLQECAANPSYLRRFAHTHVPEEMFFQTLIMASPYAKHVVNDNLRYVDWVARNGNNPAVLDLSDLDKVVASGKLFARKLVPPLSQGLINALRERTSMAQDHPPAKL